MALFRFLLISIFIGITVYTIPVIATDGLNLFPFFFGDMAAVGWPGQFNFDFMCFLILSALWTAWRNAFSPGGAVLAVMAFFGGAFSAPICSFSAIVMTRISRRY